MYYNASTGWYELNYPSMVDTTQYLVPETVIRTIQYGL